MYAMISDESFDREVDFEPGQDVGELHYWRKHPDLHGWMEALYFEKGGEQDFNCTPVVLNEDDIGRLEADIKAGNLPPTQGFFFGASDGSDSEDDLTFIVKAREAIADSDTVFYYAWW